jgi:hypothetical protein
MQSVLQRSAQAQRPNPYSPSYHDPYDRKVDSIGDQLDPIPYRNGKGATIMGPQNRDRTRQNPDLMRPPSVDHGDLKNMRWSFADSHVRIEVSNHWNWSSVIVKQLTIARKVVGRGRQPLENFPRVLSLQVLICGSMKA